MVVATYSITDERKEKVSFAGPYFIAGQDLLVRADDTVDHRPGHPQRQEALLGHGLHLGRRRSRTSTPASSCRSSAPTPSASPALATKGVDALTTDNTILAGYAAQPEYKGKFKVVGKTVLRGELRHRPEEGRHRHSARRSTTRIKKMVADGSWQKAVDANLGPAGFKPGTAATRRRPTACS